MNAGDIQEAAKKRFIAHDFLIGSPVLIDRAEHTMSFYRKNIYGQIYNLDNPERVEVSDKKISGLIRRLNNPNDSFRSEKVVDRYIYNYLMTDEQREKCRFSPYNDKSLIIASDSYHEAIRGMCEYVFQDASPHDIKPGDRENALAIGERHLSSRDDMGQPLQPRSVTERLREVKESIQPPQAGTVAMDKDAR